MRHGVRGAESRVINSLVAGKFPLYIKRLRDAQVFRRCATPKEEFIRERNIIPGALTRYLNFSL